MEMEAAEKECNAISMVLFSVLGVRALGAPSLPEVARPKYFLMWTDYINNHKNSKLLNFHVVGGDTIPDFSAADDGEREREASLMTLPIPMSSGVH